MNKTFDEIIKDDDFWYNRYPIEFTDLCDCHECKYIISVLQNKALKELTLKDLKQFGIGFMALLSDDLLRYLLPQALLLTSNDEDGNILLDIIFFFSSNHALEKKVIFSEKQKQLIRSFLDFVLVKKRKMIENYDYMAYLKGAIENFS